MVLILLIPIFSSGKGATKDHPRNWTVHRKAYDTFLISLLEILTTAISIAGSSTIDQAQQEYSVGRALAVSAFVSMYLVGQVIGGVVLPPYSESFGRRTLFVATTLFYASFCAVAGAVPSLKAVFFGRFMSGLLSSAPNAVVTGSIENMYKSEERVWPIFGYEVAGVLGLSMRPIFGTYIATSIGWRWIFYLASIATTILAVLLSTIRESRPSRLLQSKIRVLRKETGHTFRTANLDHVPDLRTFLTTALTRPVRLFLTEPIIFSIAMMSSSVFGLIYLFTEAFPVVYASYDISFRQSSLTFIPLAVGPVFGVLIRVYDARTLRNLRDVNKPITPESKIFGFSLAAPALAVSLWIFAWTTPPMVSGVLFIISMIALVPVGFAVTEFEYILAGYLSDCYTHFTASASAPVSFFRSIISAAMPLFVHQMYTGLGVNVASSILATIATVFCAFPLLFINYGSDLRLRSHFARRCVELDEGV
ncbi:hypothetical protein MMC17_000604 [Xylographa soralifera]|nr:hypothetical protein [Xylographa soralifera]